MSTEKANVNTIPTKIQQPNNNATNMMPLFRKYRSIRKLKETSKDNKETKRIAILPHSLDLRRSLMAM